MIAQKNNRKMKIIVGTTLIVVALCCIGYFLYPMISQHLEKNQIIEAANASEATPENRIDFNALLAINPQTVGWVQIDGTPLEYPVVQTDNNDYYLHNSFNNEASIEGTIFLDYLCNTERTRNNVLYGHYMRDESMFGSLWHYQQQSYFTEHPVIKFDRPNDPGDWEIFAAYVTDADYDYRQPEFNDDAAFLAYMNRCKACSLYDTGVVVKPTDEVLTLSTCIYTFENARFVVQARKK
ncbi:class B sortase [Acetobacterium fimetarium]|uniref:Class B sortase n=1 Tax=Acetobacterium fimetarium TaxID=52691 RepID=A0ABR6WRS9_9FIRM|nr:class B sortase [Acetobacterium fimetarium]MBC3803237.1 class B sortase [Acetobacterium fimetarium]